MNTFNSYIKKTWSPLVYLVSFFILSVGVRLFLSDSLELDETEEILWSQKFLWGYNAQPPLYAWLTKIFLIIFKDAVLSLVLLKFSILSLFFIFLYKVLNDLVPTGAFPITLSCLLLPELLWEVQVDRANTILVLTMTSMTFYIFYKLMQKPKYLWYFLLGVCMGLGVLTKYNYVLFVIGWFGGILLVKETRSLVFDRKIFLTLIGATLITMPHVLWFLNNILTATEGTLDKLNPGHSTYIYSLSKGVLSLLMASLPYGIPVLAIYLISFTKTKKSPPAQFSSPISNRYHIPISKQLMHRLLLYFFVITYLLLLGIIAIFQFTHIQSRWLIIILCFLPLFLGLKLDWSQIKMIRIKWLKIGVVGLLVCVHAILITRRIHPDWFGHYSRLNVPFKESAEVIQRDFKKGQLILAENQFLAGNFKIHLDAEISVYPGIEFLIPQNPSATFNNILLVWAGKDKKIPSDMFASAERLIGHPLNPVTITRCAMYFKGSDIKKYDLNYSVISF